jgi:alpha-amylase
VSSITFYFQVHQPHRLRRLAYDEIGAELDAAPDYFDDPLNEMILKRVAERCYLPMNRVLLDAIEQTDGRFRCAFALTGTVLDQLEAWSPEALDSFVALAETGCVELICETACHSLAFQADAGEFEDQILSHRARLEALFGSRPTTFRNTELIFDDSIAQRVEGLGFDALLGEGADQLLNGKSPRRVYRAGGCERLKLLLRDYLFSDDIAFRFSNPEWPQFPLMANTFAEWLHRADPADEFIGLYMDYETFGEHQGPGTGILEFMEHVPGYILEDSRFDFATPAEVARAHDADRPEDEIVAPRPISWADAERDLSAWLDNPMQRAAHEALYALGPDARRVAASGHPELLDAWRKLTTSDHVYYMATKHLLSDGDVHEYFSPYESPHDSFMVFMNVLDDLTARVRAAASASPQPEPASTTLG